MTRTIKGLITLQALAICTAFAAAAQTPATLAYGYCGEPAMSFGVAWQEYTALVEFPDSFTEKFNGSKVVAVEVASPDNFINPEINNFTSMTIGFYREMGGEPFRTQPATLSDKAFTWTRIVLDSPMPVESGKPFYVGYSGKAPSIDDTCFAVDCKYNSDNLGLWLGWTDEETGENHWEPYTEWYGNLCLRLVIEGDDLPQDDMTLNGIYAPAYVVTGKPFELTAYVKNNAAGNLSSFTLEYSDGDGIRSTEIAVTPPLSYNQESEVLIPGIVCDKVGAKVPLTCRVTAVNGNPDGTVTDKSEEQMTLLSMPEGAGYRQNVVFEEGTGTWCGYCPMGIVAFREMAEKHDDGSFIPVAIHGNDPMQSDTYIAVAEKYFSGYPSVVINRDLNRFGVLQPEPELVDAAYEMSRNIPSLAEMDMTAAYGDESKTSLEVDVTSRFAIDVEGGYTLAFALTENGVGPYMQTNYFAGGDEGEMGGFEDMPDPVRMTYDDVARHYTESESLPSKISAGEEVETQCAVSLASVKGDGGFTLVGMIIDNETGVIVNARMIRSEEITSTGIQGTEDGNGLSVKVRDGRIEVSGAEGPIEVYTLSGAKAAACSGTLDVSLPSGIYLVKSAGHTLKLAVK